MSPFRAGTIATLASAALLLPGAAHSAGSATTLLGTVGTGGAFVIRLTDEAGNRVTHLAPGDYTIKVHDDSQLHNFHLTGPGVDVSTTEDFVGDVTWNVTFADGTYTYQCDPHYLRGMRGTFLVGATPPPPTKLSAAVGPRRTITLRDADGLRVSSLTAGRYRITIRDRTKVDNFHLRGPGISKATGIGFRGTVRWTLTLRAGKYLYRSDKHKALRGTFSVSAP